MHPVELAVTTTTTHAIFNNAFLIVKQITQNRMRKRTLIDLREFKRRPAASRRPRSIEELNDACFVVRDQNGRDQ